MNTKRIFFALWPDARQRDRMRDFITPVAKLVEGRAVERSEWHVTLAYIGDLDVRFIPDLMQSAQAITFGDLDNPRHRVFTLKEDSRAFRVMEDLGTEPKVCVILADVGVDPPERVYRPHVTVVRNARPFETQRLPQSAEIEWSRFELLESISEHGRTTYRPLVKEF